MYVVVNIEPKLLQHSSRTKIFTTVTEEQLAYPSVAFTSAIHPFKQGKILDC